MEYQIVQKEFNVCNLALKTSEFLNKYDGFLALFKNIASLDSSKMLVFGGKQGDKIDISLNTIEYIVFLPQGSDICDINLPPSAKQTLVLSNGSNLTEVGSLHNAAKTIIGQGDNNIVLTKPVLLYACKGTVIASSSHLSDIIISECYNATLTIEQHNNSQASQPINLIFDFNITNLSNIDYQEGTKELTLTLDNNQKIIISNYSNSVPLRLEFKEASITLGSINHKDQNGDIKEIKIILNDIENYSPDQISQKVQEIIDSPNLQSFKYILTAITNKTFALASNNFALPIIITADDKENIIFLKGTDQSLPYNIIVPNPVNLKIKTDIPTIIDCRGKHPVELAVLHYVNNANYTSFDLEYYTTNNSTMTHELNISGSFDGSRFITSDIKVYEYKDEVMQTHFQLNLEYNSTIAITRKMLEQTDGKLKVPISIEKIEIAWDNGNLIIFVPENKIIVILVGDEDGINKDYILEFYDSNLTVGAIDQQKSIESLGAQILVGLNHKIDLVPKVNTDLYPKDIHGVLAFRYNGTCSHDVSGKEISNGTYYIGLPDNTGLVIHDNPENNAIVPGIAINCDDFNFVLPKQLDNITNTKLNLAVINHRLEGYSTATKNALLYILQLPKMNDVRCTDLFGPMVDVPANYISHLDDKTVPRILLDLIIKMYLEKKAFEQNLADIISNLKNCVPVPNNQIKNLINAPERDSETPIHKILHKFFKNNKKDFITAISALRDSSSLYGEEDGYQNDQYVPDVEENNTTLGQIFSKFKSLFSSTTSIPGVEAGQVIAKYKQGFWSKHGNTHSPQDGQRPIIQDNNAGSNSNSHKYLTNHVLGTNHPKNNTTTQDIFFGNTTTLIDPGNLTFCNWLIRMFSKPGKNSCNNTYSISENDQLQESVRIMNSIEEAEKKYSNTSYNACFDIPYTIFSNESYGTNPLGMSFDGDN